VADPGGAAAPQEITKAFLCSGCGICELYACPHEISPRLMFDEIKALLAQKKVANPHRVQDLASHPWRESRRLPLKRLVLHLGLLPYEHPAPLVVPTSQPSRVALALKQSAGQPAQPLVQEGDRVSCGQIIGTVPADAFGAPLHASISGRVRRVDQTAIVIEGEGI
jgi:Na+-translocating ferredoxin:NAD+ oxidoreductase RnfC subunit